MPSAKILSISCDCKFSSRLDLRRAVKVLAVEKKRFNFND